MRILHIGNKANSPIENTKDLLSAGLDANFVYSEKVGLELLQLYSYDLILLVCMPDRSVRSTLKHLRQNQCKTPVIVVSDLADPTCESETLNLGADDYLVAPVALNVLIARIHAIVRRVYGFAHSVIAVGDLTVNLNTRKVHFRGQPVQLSKLEYEALQYMAMRYGRTLSRDDFINHLYGGRANEPDIRSVDALIKKIRKKFREASGDDDTPIETQWCAGYTLKAA